MDADQQVQLGLWLREKRNESSLAKMAERFGCAKSSWQRYESGERAPPDEMLWALRAAYPDFPAFALPKMYAPTSPRALLRAEEERTKFQYSARVSRDSEFVDLPFHDLVAAAGTGKINEDAPAKTYLSFRRDWVMWRFGSAAGLSLIRAEGDSMVKSFPDGATLMIRRRQSINVGKGVYLLRIAGEHYVKRLVDTEMKADEDGNVSLHASVVSDTDDQKTHPPKRIVFSSDEDALNTVLARVVWAAIEIE